MTDNEEKIALLEVHKMNLVACNSFEEFKSLQCAFLDVLIADAKAEHAREEYAQWVAKSELVVRVETTQAEAPMGEPSPLDPSGDGSFRGPDGA